MKRLVLILTALFLLASCGNSPISHTSTLAKVVARTAIRAAEIHADVGASYALPLFDDTFEIQHDSWQDAYAYRLRYYMQQFTDEWGIIYAHFALHELGDGWPPELVIFEGSRDSNEIIVSSIAAYNFLANGNLRGMLISDISPDGLTTHIVTEANIRNIILNEEPKVAQAASWQEAYAALLRHYEPILRHNTHGHPRNVYFMVHDMDGDGVPELLIFTSGAGQWLAAAYTFADGQSMRLGAPDFFFYHTIGTASDGRMGIFASYIAVRSYDHIMLVDGELIVVDSIWADPGYVDNPQWFVNGIEVTEEEYDNAYNRIFANVNWTFPLIANEANIRDEIMLSLLSDIIAETWQEAYEAMLWHYDNQPLFGHEYGWSFALHDINRNGTPELFLIKQYDTGHFRFQSAYTFTSGGIVPLDLGDMRGTSDGGSFVPLDGAWIAKVFLAGSSEFFFRLELDGNRLVTTHTGSAMLTEEGHERSWYSGFDFQSYNYHNLTVNEDAVTRDQFLRTFGSRDERRPLQIHEINKETIQDVIFGPDAQLAHTLVEFLSTEYAFAFLDYAIQTTMLWAIGHGYRENVLPPGMQYTPDGRLRLMPFDFVATHIDELDTTFLLVNFGWPEVGGGMSRLYAYDARSGSFNLFMDSNAHIVLRRDTSQGRIIAEENMKGFIVGLHNLNMTRAGLISSPIPEAQWGNYLENEHHMTENFRHLVDCCCYWPEATLIRPHIYQAAERLAMPIIRQYVTWRDIYATYLYSAFYGRTQLADREYFALYNPPGAHIPYLVVDGMTHTVNDTVMILSRLNPFRGDPDLLERHYQRPWDLQIFQILYSFDSNAQSSATTWQEAYSARLQEYMQRPPLIAGSIGWHFLLHDIDEDGIPELLVTDSWNTKSVNHLFAYTFVDGELETLNIDYFGWQFFERADGRPGIVTDSGTGVGASMAILVMEGRRLVVEDRLAWDDEDFDDRFNDIFRGWSGLHIPSHVVNEANIHNVILGSVYTNGPHALN